jgi:hypothetical protein
MLTFASLFTLPPGEPSFKVRPELLKRPLSANYKAVVSKMLHRRWVAASQARAAQQLSAVGWVHVLNRHTLGLIHTYAVKVR